jgi:hypothetical protein
MYRTARTSTIYVTIAAAAVALTLLTSTTLTTSVYAARIHHHSHRSIEGMPTSIGGYQAYGNGNNPVGNQVNGPPVSDQANGNGNNPVGKEQIQTQQAPTIAYKLPWSNDTSISSASSSQPLCAAGICSQSSTQNKNVAPQNAASSTTQTTTADPTTQIRSR